MIKLIMEQDDTPLQMLASQIKSLGDSKDSPEKHAGMMSPQLQTNKSSTPKPKAALVKPTKKPFVIGVSQVSYHRSAEALLAACRQWRRA